jgi:hypothetical protein
MNFHKLFENARDAWLIIFAAYYLLLVIVGIAQNYKRKGLLDTPSLPIIIFIHYGLILPVVIPILFVFWVIAKILEMPFYFLAGLFWLRDRVFGKSEGC